jgi:signal transduction histidine kinase
VRRTRTAHRLVAIGVVAAMLGLAALVVTAVLDAQRRGREALDRLKREQIGQLASSMDARIEGVFGTLEALAGFPYELVPGSARDREILETYQRQQGEARTGFLLVDAAGRVTSGTLLRDPSAVGTRLSRPGLAEALRAARPAMLPAAPGLTTPRPTVALVAPLLDGSGHVRGGFVAEAEISATSSFNQEMAALGGRDGGEFMFVDQRGTVVASSNPALLGRPLDDPWLATAPPGLHRRHGQVQAVADVPVAGWRAVFRQDAAAFEGGLARRVQTAVLLVVVGGLLAAGVAGATLAARLRAVREEQRRTAEIAAVRERFVGIVSHELRTPVAGVLGFLQATLDHWHLMSDEARRDAVARAAANARRLHALSSDVLDAEQAAAGELPMAFGPVDLAEELRAAAVATAELQPGVEVQVRGAEAPVWVNADADRIRQVLFNLLDNAHRVNPAGRPVEVSLAAGPTEVTVTVADHGPGLAPEELETVFDKFARGRAAGPGGAGLGLFIARRIVEAHGGRIRAASRPGGGATFSFTLPLAPRPAEPVTSPP